MIAIGFLSSAITFAASMFIMLFFVFSIVIARLTAFIVLLRPVLLPAFITIVLVVLAIVVLGAENAELFFSDGAYVLQGVGGRFDTVSGR